MAWKLTRLQKLLCRKLGKDKWRAGTGYHRFFRKSIWRSPNRSFVVECSFQEFLRFFVAGVRLYFAVDVDKLLEA